VNIPHFDYNSNGLPLHFLHANGYPPDCYKPLLELLRTQYQLFGMTLRPLWPDSKLEDINNWHPFSDDLLRFLSTKTGPLSGWPSSSIVTAAALRDRQIRALILLDPVLASIKFDRLESCPAGCEKYIH
jgi:hypothetical protein